MTQKEHLLLLTLFTKQQQIIQSLGSLLKSHGLASADDLRAFEFAETQDDHATSVLLQSTKEFYLHVADQLGIATGLETS